MQDKNTSISNCLPFIIGVTGHRDIDPSIELKPVIREVLNAWRDQIGINTPIHLLNGLAAGADLLIAEVALELQKEWGEDKLKIIGCLPMPIANYKADFENLEYAPDAIEKLESVVAQIENGKGEVFSVRTMLSDSDYQYAIQDTNYGELRNSLYVNQGLFVAKYSNVLLSLWDGKPAKGAGGTADVTHYKLGQDIDWPNDKENKALARISDFDGQTAGLVHHIYVKRYVKPQKSNVIQSEPQKPIFIPSSFGNPSTSGYLYDCANNESKSESGLASFITKEFTTLIEQVKTYNGMAVDFVSEKDKEKSLQDIADNIAASYQQKYRIMMFNFLLIAIIGYAIYELIGDPIVTSTEIRAMLVFIVVMMVIAASLKIREASKKDWKWKYQLARGVAEGGRIRSGLNLADIPPSSSPLIPRTYRLHLALVNHIISITELEWWRNKKNYSHALFESKDLIDIEEKIPNPEKEVENIKSFLFFQITKFKNTRKVLLEIKIGWLILKFKFHKDAPLKEKYEVHKKNYWEIASSRTNSQWIKSQSEFLETRLSLTCNSLGDFFYKRPKLAALEMDLWAKACFRGAIYSGVMLLFLLVAQFFMGNTIFNGASQWLMRLVQFCLVACGVIALWRELSGYESTSEGYSNLKLLYERADKLLEGDFTPSKHQMLLDLAREAIFEHASWTMSESSIDLKSKK